MNKIIKRFPLLIGLVLIPISMSLANNLKLQGTLLVPPPCTIENDNVIDISFGNNVGLHKVDGINYTQEIGYDLHCEPNNKGWELMLSLRGPKSTYDDATLQTNITNLGIRITQNGQAFDIDKPIKITYANPPVLKAVLVKKPGTTLPEGAFSVTATLLAEYQ